MFLPGSPRDWPIMKHAMWGSQYQDHRRGKGGRAVGTPCRHLGSKAAGFPNFECWSAEISGELCDSGWRDSVCFGLGCREQPGSPRLFAFKPDQVAMDPSPHVVSDALPSPAQMSQGGERGHWGMRLALCEVWWAHPDGDLAPGVIEYLINNLTERGYHHGARPRGEVVLQYGFVVGWHHVFYNERKVTS